MTRLSIEGSGRKTLRFMSKSHAWHENSLLVDVTKDKYISFMTTEPSIPSSPRFRIAVIRFMHETVTFLPNDTTLEDFIYPGSPAAGESLLGSDPRGYMGGFVTVAREYDGVELVGLESPLMPRTGIGSGWITQEAFEHFAGRMMAAMREQGPFDGVFMSLHGAMGVRGVPRPEAELARRAREVVGPGAIIAATFDPHGNEDEEFLRHADLAFSAKYYPHYDTYLQGERAARTLVRCLRGTYRPTSATRKVPIVSPTVVQWTGASPWMDLVQRALTWEAREPDTYVNVFFGFPWADVPDLGMTMQVIANGKPELARRIVDDMCKAAWRQREALLNAAKVLAIEDGVAQARRDIAAGRSPVVLADHSDRSGYATWLLREIIAQGMARTLVVSVADREAVAALKASGAQPDSPVDLSLGGRIDASAGEPVRLRGRVIGSGQASDGTGVRSDWVGIAFGDGNVLVLTSYLMQVMETGMLEAMGFRLGDFDAFALKSRVHFRRGFDDSGFAAAIYLVEPKQPFLGTVRLDALDYRHVDLRTFYPYGDPDFAA
jgi:microcystin degradation protein MlrC